jgi:hypothetical protein
MTKKYIPLNIDSFKDFLKIPKGMISKERTAVCMGGLTLFFSLSLLSTDAK